MPDFWDSVPDATPNKAAAPSGAGDFWSNVPDAPKTPTDLRNPALPAIPLSPRAVPFRLRPDHQDTGVDRALEYTSGLEYDPGQMITRGAQSISSGVRKMGNLGTPEGRQRTASGVHDVIGGAMEGA